MTHETQSEKDIILRFKLKLVVVQRYLHALRRSLTIESQTSRNTHMYPTMGFLSRPFGGTAKYLSRDTGLIS